MRLSRGAAVLLGFLTLVSPAWAVDDAERMRRAVTHILSVQREDGLFLYDYDFLAGEPTGADHIVRQAGVLFALGEYRLASGDARLDPVLRGALEQMEARSLPVGRSTAQAALEALGLLSVRSLRWGAWLQSAGLLYTDAGSGLLVAADGSYAQALPGATALALVGELAYREATGDDRFAKTREAWLRGLQVLYVAGRGMRYSPERLESDVYADGEAWYALARLVRVFPGHPVASRMLEDLEAILLARYADDVDVRFYHWGAIAAAERFATTRDPRLAGFVARQSEAFLAKWSGDEMRRETTCSVIEGIASALAVLEAGQERPPVVAALRRRLELELAHNRALQIEPGQERLALGGGGTLVAPTLARHAGAFLAGRHRAYWRLDMDLHCISALLRVERLRGGPPEGG